MNSIPLLIQEAKRIAIAQSRGWTYGWANVNPDHSAAEGFWFKGRFHIGLDGMPDYYNDRAAISEAIDNLPEASAEACITAWQQAWERRHARPLSDRGKARELFSATAAQLADAYIYVIGEGHLLNSAARTRLWRRSYIAIGEERVLRASPDIFVWAPVVTATGEVDMHALRAHGDELEPLAEGCEWRRFRMVPTLEEVIS